MRLILSQFFLFFFPGAATQRFGKHGEKAEYGKSFGDTVNNPNHFPGSIPTAAGSATTNTGKPRGDV